MIGALTAALNETLDLMMRLSQEGTRPAEAQARLRHLHERHLDIEMELIWEEEGYDGSVHYDALLHRSEEGGTVSLGFCPDRALPWPLRGVHRWRDGDLMRVNQTVLKVDQAIACLDFIWDDARIIDRLVNACLIQEAVEGDSVELSDAELQWAMDGFRRAHRLYTVEKTHRWMEWRGLSQELLERYVADEALVAKLRQRVSTGRVEEYFDEHRAAFDAACIALFTCPDERTAQQVSQQVRAGMVDFYAAAERYFLATDATTGLPRDLFVVVHRGQAPMELEAAVFASAPGEVLGPLRGDGGYVVARVLSFAPARLHGPTRSAIEKILFEQWLLERRQAATIEWYWGNVARTSLVAGG